MVSSKRSNCKMRGEREGRERGCECDVVEGHRCALTREKKKEKKKKVCDSPRQNRSWLLEKKTTRLRAGAANAAPARH